MTKAPKRKAPAKAGAKSRARRAPAKGAKGEAAKRAAAKEAPDYDPFGDRRYLDERRAAAAEQPVRQPRADASEEAEEDWKRAAAAEQARREALLGNRFWQARAKHGRDKIFAGPENLMAAAEEYFEWVAQNPLYEDKFYTADGIPGHDVMAKMRPMTLTGLCNFLGIGEQTWRDYAKRKDFSGVCTRVAQIIYQHKFDGAAAGFLNHSIIARDLGLAETVKNPEGSLALLAAMGKMSEAQLEELIASLAAGVDVR